MKLLYDARSLENMRDLFHEEGYAYFMNVLAPDHLALLQGATQAWVDSHDADPTYGLNCYDHYLELPDVLRDFYNSPELARLVRKVTDTPAMTIVNRGNAYQDNEFGGKLNVYRGGCNFRPHVDRWTTKGKCQVAMVLTLQSTGGTPYHLRLYGSRVFGQVPAVAVALQPGTLTLHMPNVFHEVVCSDPNTVRTALLMQASDDVRTVSGLERVRSTASAGFGTALHFGRTLVQGTRKK